MEFFTELLSWILHLDQHLGDAVSWMGQWFYVLVFGIVFCETGLVITPFLPGDSLLFGIGALAGTQPEHLNIWILLPLLIIAAISGDAVNYSIGKWIGPVVFRKESGWLLNRAHLMRAQSFYEKHGGKAIILARFLPVLRTFAPFVAGIGKMEYRKFWIYNMVGGVSWVVIFLMGGYLFSHNEYVQKNFSFVVIAIIILSVVPILIEWYRSRTAASR